MFYIRAMIICTIAIFLASTANAQFETCLSLPPMPRFQCQTRIWSLGFAEQLIQLGRADVVIFSMRKAGCQLIGSDIRSEIQSCRAQLNNDFGCKFAISLVRNTGINNNVNLITQCCSLYRRCCDRDAC